MTFSENIKREFIEEIPNKTCCRRAFAYGILFDSFVDGDRVYIDTSDLDYADFYRRVFERQFSKEITLDSIKKAGREYVRVKFVFPSVAKKIVSLDKEGALMRDYMEFKCPMCRMNFLRGIFLSRATIPFIPSFLHADKNAGTPKRTPWSVRATASCPHSFARFGMSFTLHAPSSKLYSLCKCKCTNSPIAFSFQSF